MVRNWSGDPPGGSDLVGTPSRKFGSGQETLPEVWMRSETLPEVWNWSGNPAGGPEAVRDPPGGPELLRTPSRRSDTGRDTLPDVRKQSETLVEVRNWLGHLPEV